VLHEVLECGECSRANPVRLQSDDRLEHASEPPTFQHDFGLTDQERLIALRLHSPFVSRSRDERNPKTLIGERPTLVPRQPTLADRDASAEIAGSLGANTVRERSLAACVENRL
jgi:hypothetical protein